MLLVVIHHCREYLEALKLIAQKQGVGDMMIFESKSLVARILGSDIHLTMERGRNIDAYDKAFIASVSGEEQKESLLSLIDENMEAEILRGPDKGFVCALAFDSVNDFVAQKISEQQAKMRLGDFFTRDRIVTDLKAKNKQEAIVELALLMKTAEEMLRYDLFLQDVYRRESLQSTGIGEGVAIPHARTDSVADSVAALGISRQGIEFDSIDGKPARIILIAASPNHKGVNGYLGMMSLFTKFLGKDSFRQTLLRAKTADEIIEVLKKR